MAFDDKESRMRSTHIQHQGANEPMLALVKWANTLGLEVHGGRRYDENPLNLYFVDPTTEVRIAKTTDAAYRLNPQGQCAQLRVQILGWERRRRAR